jgi:hypothetical protein
VAQKHSEIGGRHMELLCVIADLARNDPGAVAQMEREGERKWPRKPCVTAPGDRSFLRSWVSSEW